MNLMKLFQKQHIKSKLFKESWLCLGYSGP